MVADTTDVNGEPTNTDHQSNDNSEMTDCGYTKSTVHTVSPKVDSHSVMPLRGEEPSSAKSQMQA